MRQVSWVAHAVLRRVGLGDELRAKGRRKGTLQRERRALFTDEGAPVMVDPLRVQRPYLERTEIEERPQQPRKEAWLQAVDCGLQFA